MDSIQNLENGIGNTNDVIGNSTTVNDVTTLFGYLTDILQQILEKFSDIAAKFATVITKLESVDTEMDGLAKEASLNSQIEDLKEQVKELKNTVTNSGTIMNLSIPSEYVYLGNGSDDNKIYYDMNLYSDFVLVPYWDIDSTISISSMQLKELFLYENRFYFQYDNSGYSSRYSAVNYVVENADGEKGDYMLVESVLVYGKLK